MKFISIIGVWLAFGVASVIVTACKSGVLKKSDVPFIIFGPLNFLAAICDFFDSDDEIWRRR